MRPVLADDLVEDCNRLLKLGIMLDKGALGAKAAGVTGGAFAAAQGHWLIGRGGSDRWPAGERRN